MKKYFFLFLSFTVIQLELFSQDEVYKLNDVLPPSPEAAAFAKNVNIPVSYSTGTPQISIPFSSVKSGSIEIPVSISYNASGIRVEEVASWVGLGWNLSAGGQISRTVRGKPDEQGDYGYIVTPYYRSVKYMDSVLHQCPGYNCTECATSGSSEGWAIEHDYNIYGILDPEPDEYNFSVLGYSGKFIYNQDSAKFILVPYQNIKIEGSPVTGSFTLILPNGIKGYFGGCDSCKEVLLSGTSTSYIDNYSQAPVSIGNTPQVTTWYLTRIEDPAGNIIDLSYRAESIITYGRGGERFGLTITDGSYQNRRQSFFKQYIKKAVLYKISGESGNIYFKQSSAHRQDMPDYMYGARSLDTITITNTNNEELKSFYFNYDYSISSDSSLHGVLGITSYLQESRKRLYLKSIRGKSGSDSLPPYTFTYNATELPNTFSTAQDYWGYYNGKSTNGMHIMPRIPLLPFYAWDPDYNQTTHNLPPYGQYRNSDGSDRRLDTNYNQAGILKKVQYPTGGITEYFYETNEAATMHNLDIYGGMEPPDMVDKSYSLNLMSNPITPDPPYPLYFPGTFTINVPVTKLKIIPQLPTCTTYVSGSCILQVKLKRLPDSTLITTINTTSTFDLQLPSGQYLAEVFVNASPNDPPPMFNVGFQWGERLDSMSFKVGGLRVKKIISSDSVAGRITRSFKYKYEGTNESSGTLEGVPTYKIHDLNCSGQLLREYFESNSVIPLSREGRTLRYNFVSEFYDTAQSSFKTNYTFTSGLSDPLWFFAGAQKGAPLLNWDWQNSLLKKKQVYEKTSAGTYRILSNEENFYQFYEPLTTLYGLYGGQALPYSIANEWYLPDSKILTTYSYHGSIKDSLQTTSQTLYNANYLPSLNTTVSSEAEVIHNKTWYPTDYNDVSGYNISALYSKHIWAIPIKQETSINGKIRTGSIIKYNAYGQPLDGYSYENAVLSDTVTHNRNTVLESNYNLKTSLRYDVNGNIRQMNNNKSGPATYIWDYQINGFTGAHMNEFPVASVQNADSFSVAYSSFEEVGTGNWNITGGSVTTNPNTPMGSKYYSISGSNLSKTGLTSSTTYIVSYWSKNGSYALSGNLSVKQGKTLNGWTYYEHEVTGITTLTITGTGYIDELRLYPKGSLMTTYSYKYGVGLATQCDPASHFVYYEYDNFQRLSLVRDEDKNVLKKICYNYTGQPVGCGYDTTAAWTAVSSSCQQNSGINTGYMIVVEKNINPSSATYNQTRNVTIASAGACFVCNETTCTGPDKKCFNNTCEIGIRINTGTTWYLNKFSGLWICYYHYQWSDNSTSPTYQDINPYPCSF